MDKVHKPITTQYDTASSKPFTIHLCLLYRPLTTWLNTKSAFSAQRTVYAFRIILKTYSIDLLVLLEEKQCVFCEVGMNFEILFMWIWDFKVF
jgi:hypothetical protein